MRRRQGKTEQTRGANQASLSLFVCLSARASRQKRAARGTTLVVSFDPKRPRKKVFPPFYFITLHVPLPVSEPSRGRTFTMLIRAGYRLLSRRLDGANFFGATLGSHHLPLPCLLLIGWVPLCPFPTPSFPPSLPIAPCSFPPSCIPAVEKGQRISGKSSLLYLFHKAFRHWTAAILDPSFGTDGVRIDPCQNGVCARWSSIFRVNSKLCVLVAERLRLFANRGVLLERVAFFFCCV